MARAAQDASVTFELHGRLYPNNSCKCQACSWHRTRMVVEAKNNETKENKRIFELHERLPLYCVCEACSAHRERMDRDRRAHERYLRDMEKLNGPQEKSRELREHEERLEREYRQHLREIMDGC